MKALTFCPIQHKEELATQKSMKPILYQPSLTMHILPLLAYITSYAAAAAVDVSTAIKSNDYDDEYPNEQIKVEHWGDWVVTTVTAWNVMVVVSS